MRKQSLLLSVFAFAVLVFSCKKDKIIKPSSPSYNYFPTEQGKYVIYNVDSVVHSTNDNNNDDSVSTYHFQLKYVVDSSFNDLERKRRQVLAIYYRDSLNTTWTIRNVWSQLLTSSSAYRYEDNIPYHRLAFPINTTIRWDGNDMNTYDEEQYEYEDIHSSSEMSSMDFNHVTTTLQFDSTITILQVDDLNFIEKIYGKEAYAENVGMIYHQRDELSFNGVGQISSGTEYKMTVQDYGPR